MKNPYSLTTAIFVIIAIIGAWLLNWRDENFAFILLLYFIITLGIKLDEIAGQIGIPDRDRTYPAEKDKNIIKQLEKINASMDTLNRTLDIFAENSKQNDTGPGPVDRFPNTDEKRDHRPENPEK